VGLDGHIEKLASLSIELNYGLLNGGVREQNAFSTSRRNTHEIRVKMQIATRLSLEWSCCPDGYEIVPQDGDPLEPTEEYEAMLQRDPQNASALAGLARCCLKSGDLERAQAIIGQLVPDELKNPAVKRAFRDVKGGQWARLELQAYPERTSPAVLPDEWTHSLLPRTTAVTTTRPLDYHAGLYRQFAALAFEPNCYRKFADEFGPLIDVYSPSLWVYASFHACVRRVLGLAAPAWVLQHLTPLAPKNKAAMDAAGPLIVLGAGDNLDPLTRLTLMIEHGCASGVARSAIDSRLEIVIRPRNLMVAIALQTVRHLPGEQQRTEERTGVKLMQCEHCSKHFEAGPGTRRRRTSKFCSTKCGNESRYAKRSAKEIEGRQPKPG
jgi:Tetratricopeptide repeat